MFCSIFYVFRSYVFIVNGNSVFTKTSRSSAKALVS
jgi:hypothetical protein